MLDPFDKSVDQRLVLALVELAAVQEGQEVFDDVLALIAVLTCPVVLVVPGLVETLFDAGGGHDGDVACSCWKRLSCVEYC